MWSAIALLLDAAFGLWNHEKVEVVAPKLNILRIALLEALIALVLILMNLFL